MFPSGVKFLIGVFPDLFGTVAGCALQDLAIKWVRSSFLLHQQSCVVDLFCGSADSELLLSTDVMIINYRHHSRQ